VGGENRLSGLDSAFLHLERSGAHMHVASTILFEGPPPAYEEFRDHIASRLHLVPRFRQKLRFVPLGQGRPVWVDDPHLNLSYHVRQTALPPPGTEAQLRTLSARIFSQQLDRTKPLWEMWLVEGLDRGRFAIVAKSHHALVDGISGVDITSVLFDASREPEAPPEASQDWIPAPEPSDTKLLADSLLERATSPAEVVRGVRAVMRGPRRVARELGHGLDATRQFLGAARSAPPTPFNVSIGPHRRVAWVRADLGELKRIKNELGGTVNDVVLAAVAGALGRYLRARGHDTSELEVRVMAPVSVRAEHERGALGNRVAAMMAPLPVWCEDSVERLRLVTGTMGDLKRSKQAVGAQILTQLTDFAPTTIASQAARLQPAQRFFNLVVTNVPGPQFPLYLLGREMEAIFPMVPLARRQALCVGLMSYNGRVDFGLIGDYDAMPDLDSVALDLEASIKELAEAVPKPKRRPRARKAAAKAGKGTTKQAAGKAGAKADGAKPRRSASRARAKS
jgi:diacylglycerol O-acyltransferase / wax synthase